MSPDNGSSGTIKMIQLRKMDEKSRLFDRGDVHASTIYTFAPLPFQTTSNLNLLHTSYLCVGCAGKFKETGNV